MAPIEDVNPATDAERAFLDELRGLVAKFEAAGESVTLAEVGQLVAAIDYVAAATTPAQFATRWRSYERKKMLALTRALIAIARRL